jgi:hypothetical protein
MKEVTAEGEDEGQHSDLSPYHSDSDSAVMMSGNSPYISKVSNTVSYTVETYTITTLTIRKK